MVRRRSPVVTLMDVARAAGVSLATASRALNGSSRRVGADLQQRVLTAAAQLDYTANAQAQAVARGQTNVVGLVVHDIADPYFSGIAAGLISEAEQHGLIVTISTTGRRPDKELEYVAALRSQRARAVVLAGSRIADPAVAQRLAAELASFQATGGRVVAVSRNRLGVDTVLLPNRSAARALAGELVASGHRRFAILAGPRDLVTARDRLAGFRRGLTDAGLSPVRVVHGEFTRDGGYRAAVALLAQTAGATCVFAVNDVMAVGAMAAMRQRGVPLPEGMAVAGFDDIATLRDVTPALTTVRLPLERVGRAALNLVLRERADRPRQWRMPGQVVLRDSTARCRAADDKR